MTYRRLSTTTASIRFFAAALVARDHNLRPLGDSPAANCRCGRGQLTKTP
jgi:hypothetical protein